MKNKLLIILLVTGTYFLLTGCQSNEEKKELEKIDYSKYAFSNIRYTRAAQQDTEYIRFSSDGSFSYYCACGNPVNDSDLCETYTYNEKTQTIKLNCFEVTDEIVTKIKVISYDENKIELDFNGEVRTFTKEIEE